MADTEPYLKGKVTVSGIVPAFSGDDWFLIDKSGEFILNKDVIATVWLVGGGCDGEDGTWEGYIAPIAGCDSEGFYVNTVSRNHTGDTQFRRGGYGGDGGCVSVFNKFEIPANSVSRITVAEPNDRTGTTAIIYGTNYYCNCAGCTSKTGGHYAKVGADKLRPLFNSSEGLDGVPTPYGMVGSSGGGGMACDGRDHATPKNLSIGGDGAGSSTDHRHVAESATHYGCGGGGGGTCGWLGNRNGAGIPGGKGMGGCIIVQYKIIEKKLNVDKKYNYTYDINKTCDTDYNSNSSHSCCCKDELSGNKCGYNKKSDDSSADYIDSIKINKGGETL